MFMSILKTMEGRNLEFWPSPRRLKSDLGKFIVTEIHDLFAPQNGSCGTPATPPETSSGKSRPWKINMEPTNHKFRKEMIFQTSVIMFHVNLQGCSLVKYDSGNTQIDISIVGVVDNDEHSRRALVDIWRAFLRHFETSF